MKTLIAKFDQIGMFKDGRGILRERPKQPTTLLVRKRVQ